MKRLRNPGLIHTKTKNHVKTVIHILTVDYVALYSTLRLQSNIDFVIKLFCQKA